MGQPLVTTGDASPASVSVEEGRRARAFSGEYASWLAAALACGVVVLFYRLGTYGLWDPDEGRHAEIAREMFAGTGIRSWLLLTFNGAPYHDKPILYYWLTALAYWVGGVTPLSARVVSASAGAGVLLMSTWWARRHWGSATAIATTLVLASTVEFAALGRYGDLNMLLTCWITAGVLGAHTWVERGGRGWGLIVAAIAAGCGTLTKGFVAPVLIGATTLGYLLLHRRLAVLALGPILRAGAVYVAVTLPWYLAAGLIDPAYMRDFLVEHHLQRFLGGDRHLHPKPLIFTPLMTVVAFLPWSLLLPVLARRGFTRRPRGAAADLCLCWAVCIVGFFTFSSGKLGTYVLPAIPPLALLTGRFLVSVSGVGSETSDRRWANRAFLLIGTVFVLAAPALLWVAHSERAGALVGASWSGVLLVAIGGLVGWLAWTHQMRHAALAVAIGTMAATLVFYGDVAPRVSDVAGDAAIARAIRGADPAGAIPVVAYRTQNASLLFHLERPVPRVDFKKRLRATLAAAPKTWVITRPEHLEGLPEEFSLLASGAGDGHAAYLYERPE